MPSSAPAAASSLCHLLALTVCPLLREQLAAALTLPGPTAWDGAEPACWSPHFAEDAALAIRQIRGQKTDGAPFTLAIVDAACGTEEQLEAILTAFWEADAELSIVLVQPRGTWFAWRLDPQRLRDRLTAIRTPCDVSDLGLLMNLVASKWLRDREIERLRLPAREQADDLGEGATRIVTAEPLRASPATILVVDDDETIRLVVSQVLATTNHQILTAGNAEEAWQQWRRHRGAIKLVITDINMPGDSDGVALGQVVQAEDASVPVIYTSGYRAASQFQHLKDGVNYLSKPFGMADLLKVVERNLAGAGGGENV